jgi:hemoglobin-like flavoprotein
MGPHILDRRLEPSMTPEQIALVRTSMAALGDGDDVVRRFYDRLFELAPETRSLFPDDLEALRSSFLATLTELVASLDELPDFALQTRALGARHRGYGAQAAHFAVVRDALLETLADSLGDDFTEEHAAAWGQAYDLVAEVMQQGASAATQGPSLSSRRPR